MLSFLLTDDLAGSVSLTKGGKRHERVSTVESVSGADQLAQGY